MKPLELQVGTKSLIFNKEGKILLLNTNPSAYGFRSAWWDIPGGRINKGINLLTNLKREIKEETGISRVTSIRLIAAQDILKAGFHVVRLTYISFTDRSVVKLSSEHQKYQWLSLTEILKQKNLDPYLKQVLKDKNTLQILKDIIKDKLDRQ